MKQTELEGVRPKRIQTVEAAARDLLTMKDRAKAVKEEVDAATDEVAKALKAADLACYGWKENGCTYMVRIEDKERVQLQVKRQKAKEHE